MTKNEEEEDKWRRVGKEGAKSEASTRRPQAPYFAYPPNSPPEQRLRTARHSDADWCFSDVISSPFVCALC